jgi:hypothetical protein
LRRGGDHLLLVVAVRQPRHCVEAGREAAQLDLRGVAAQRFDEHAPALAVDRAHPAQVPVEAAGLDQLREGQLLQHR